MTDAGFADIQVVTGIPGPAGPAGPAADPLAPGVFPTWATWATQRWWRANNAPLAVQWSGIALTNNREFYSPMDLAYPITIDAWGVISGNAAVGGTQEMRCALYTADPITNLPAVRTVFWDGDGNTQPISIVGVAANNLAIGAFTTPVPVPAGRYWLATREIQSGGTTVGNVGVANNHDPRVTTGAPGPVAPLGCAGYYRDGSTGFVDSPAVATRGIYTRMVWFRVQ